MLGSIEFSSVVYGMVWYWIMLHGVLFMVSLFFCTMTMILSRGIPVWKSYSLATMSQGHTVIDFGLEATTLGDFKTLIVGIKGGRRRPAAGRSQVDVGERQDVNDSDVRRLIVC
jgi:hypothetical protein